MTQTLPLTPDEWLAHFNAREVAWKVRQRQRIEARLAAKHESRSGQPAVPVVFEPARELDSGSDGVSRDAARWLDAAHSCGWSARLIGSTAAEPTRGVVNVVTLRAARGNERVWAAWHNGAFDVAWYFGPTGMEPLGARRVGHREVVLSAPVESMSVKALLDLAKERGIVIATKNRRKDQVLVELLVRGVTHATPPARTRGVADALEGVRLVDASLAAAVASGRVPGR
jgi:hypothetical protein